MRNIEILVYCYVSFTQTECYDENLYSLSLAIAMLNTVYDGKFRATEVEVVLSDNCGPGPGGESYNPRGTVVGPSGPPPRSGHPRDHSWTSWSSDTLAGTIW